MIRLILRNIKFILFIALIIFLRIYVFSFVKVNGNSMNDYLYDGDILFLYKLGDISREDVVVISKDVNGELIIKRVIALPGESISCENGKIYINDKLYNDPYEYGTTGDFSKVVLKDDEYFVLGDNRTVSNDSRYLGAINKTDVIGKVLVRVYPFNKISLVKQIF